MVMSVTPIVCITLAFWLGRIGLIASGGCCARAWPAHPTPNRITRWKSESRLREIMFLALLVVEFGALCNEAPVNSKRSGRGSESRYRTERFQRSRSQCHIQILEASTSMVKYRADANALATKFFDLRFTVYPLAWLRKRSVLRRGNAGSNPT